MFKNFSKSVDRELIRYGLWSSCAKIKADLYDHFVSKRDSLTSAGVSPEQAEQEALTTLGSPKLIAQEANLQVSRSSWLRRQSWLSAGLLPFLGGLALSLITAICCIVFCPAKFDVLFVSLEWFPFLVSLAMISHLCLNVSIGWRGLCITAFCLAFGTTMITFARNVICPGCWFSFPSMGLAYAIGGETMCRDLGYHGALDLFERELTSWLQLIVLMSVPWIVRYGKERALKFRHAFE